MEKKLVSTTGSGYHEGEKRKGKFVVKYSGKSREFLELAEAINFYENLEEESALWDNSGIPELLDLKEFK